MPADSPHVPLPQEPDTVTTRTSAGALRREALLRPLRALELREIGMATLIAALLAWSPLTGAARVGVSVALGVAGGALWLLLRLRQPPRQHTPGWTFALPPARVGALLIAALLAFAPTLAWLVSEFTASVWENAHGLFVPFFIALLTRSALRREPAADAQASPWGLPVLAVSCMLLALDTGMQSRLLSALALVIALPGLSLVLLGGDRTRKLALPLGLAIFMIPLPSRIGDPLGIVIATALGTDLLLELVETPALRFGTLFLVGDVPFEIGQNCSGITTIYGTLGLATLLCAGTPDWRRRAVLLLIPPVVTIAGNAIRCALLFEASYRVGPWVLHSPLHGLSGLAVYWSLLALLWWTCDRNQVRERLR